MGNACTTSNICSKSLEILPQESERTLVSRRSRRDSQTIEDFHNLLSSISQRNWVLRDESFICVDKFFSYYKEYLRDQTFISELWNNAQIDDDATKGTESHSSLPQMKFLIRTGVPLDNCRSLILDIFKKTYSANDLEYECALKVAFPGGVPEVFKNVPLFSHSHQIEDVLVVHFLNDRGLDALKRIMWVYEKNVPILEYSPLLPQVVALLLLFLKEDEAYCVAKEMLETSEKLLDAHQTKNGLQSLKWHFTMTRDQFEVFLESLSSFLKDRPNDLVALWRHFNKINYDCNDLFWQLLKTLFLGYLPLPTVLKIFMAYLNEGIKIYSRFTLALLKLFENDLLQCTSAENILSVVKERCVKITKVELQMLITTAYSLRLGQLKQRMPTIQPQTFHAPESTKLYFPQLSKASSITSTPHFETIWEWLSNDWKLTNPMLAYCSKTDGWSLHTLYAKCNEMSSYKGLLILIKTVDSVTFGAFVDGMIETTGGTTSIGTDESFVFQLEPEEKRYKSTRQNEVHMMCDRDFFSIGGGNEGPAIYLSNDLLYGYSYRSETYENEPLNGTNETRGTHFECSAVEIYWVD